MSRTKGLLGFAFAASACLALCGLASLPVQGGVYLAESFDTDTATTADTLATYTDFALAGGGNAVVTNGALNLSGTYVTNTFQTTTGFPGDLLIQLDLGKVPGGGSSNVGLRIGGNRLVFHPGYGGGAFRVEGNGGFGNTNMGFTPPGNGVMIPMTVQVNAATKQFLITVTDPTDPSHVFNATFTNPNYNPGVDLIGPTRNTSSAVEVGLYDNLLIRTPGSNAAWIEAILASKPLHWYSLDETSGTTALDSGSSPLNGTYQNGADLGQGHEGPAGGAVRFDGVNDQILLGGADLTSAWTAEFVIQRLGLRQAGSLMRSGPGALRLDQWNNTGQVGFTRFGVADYRFTPAVTAPIDQFVHLAYVADPTSGIKLYMDAQLAGTNPTFIPLPMGSIGAGDCAYMLLDEVVIYDRALSQAELALHASTIPEPATLTLLALGALGLHIRRRRSR